ncbi:MAG: glutaredoxin [Eubacterium sp.]|nr:glutaredoxin [Eubacterium sp.]
MKLKLYMFETCPFCRKVINAIQESGRTDIEMHDIHKSEADRMYLRTVGGKEQVPCLFIDGKPLYESTDIIIWLKAHPQGA